MMLLMESLKLYYITRDIGNILYIQDQSEEGVNEWFFCAYQLFNVYILTTHLFFFRFSKAFETPIV